jgi:hypothetical protein
MVTADQTGYVKYWQSNMNNVKMFQAHKEPVRAIRWAFVDSFWRTAGDVSIDQIISISIFIAIKKQISKLSFFMHCENKVLIFSIFCQFLSINDRNYLLN